MSTDMWIVERIEEHGGRTRTQEMESETEADALYANWCENINRFNDQTISLIRVTRAETLISRHINTEFKKL